MDNIEPEMIKASLNRVLLTYPGTYPIIALDKGYENNKSVIYLDSNSKDLEEKIEELAKSLKRRDVNKILILQENVLNHSLITKIGLSFLNEDVFLQGVIAYSINQKAAEQLHENFSLRIMCYEMDDFKGKSYIKK